MKCKVSESKALVSNVQRVDCSYALQNCVLLILSGEELIAWKEEEEDLD